MQATAGMAHSPDARRKAAQVALIASLVLFAAMLAKAGASTLLPAYRWPFDILGFVVAPIAVLAIASRTTGWDWQRLAGFALRAPRSIFDPPRWVVVGIAALVLAAADILLTVLLLKPIAWLQQVFPARMGSVQALIAEAPVRWLGVIYMCLSAGIVEEILYRGLTAHYFLDPERPRAVLYVLTTTAMFAVGHVGRGAGVMLMALATGLIFGTWFVRTRDLTTLVTTHALVDFWWFK